MESRKLPNLGRSKKIGRWFGATRLVEIDKSLQPVFVGPRSATFGHSRLMSRSLAIDASDGTCVAVSKASAVRNSRRGAKPLPLNEAIKRRRIASRDQCAHGSRQHQISAEHQQFFITVRRRRWIQRAKPAEHHEMEQIKLVANFAAPA